MKGVLQSRCPICVEIIGVEIINKISKFFQFKDWAAQISVSPSELRASKFLAGILVFCMILLFVE